MKLADEYASLSRHSMLFLVAVFAFVSKPLLESSHADVRLVFAIALIAAAASFVAGYRTLLHMYEQERSYPSENEFAPPTTASVKRAQLQYYLTMTALALAVLAVVLAILHGPFAKTA